MGEILFVISLIAFLILPFMFLTGKGRIFWLVTMATIGTTVGVSEIVSKISTGKTISNHFWTWSLIHPGTAWLVLGLLALGWGSLLLHLAWKLINKKKETE